MDVIFRPGSPDGIKESTVQEVLHYFYTLFLLSLSIFLQIFPVNDKQTTPNTVFSALKLIATSSRCHFVDCHVVIGFEQCFIQC